MLDEMDAKRNRKQRDNANKDIEQEDDAEEAPPEYYFLFSFLLCTNHTAIMY